MRTGMSDVSFSSGDGKKKNIRGNSKKILWNQQTHSENLAKAAATAASKPKTNVDVTTGKNKTITKEALRELAKGSRTIGFA